MSKIEFITDDFVQQEVSLNPNTLNEIGEFVYYRTYSRWLPEKNRREYWQETVQRAINYNMNLAYQHLLDIGLKPNVRRMRKEAEKTFKNVYGTKQFCSGRTLWIGGANETVNKNFVLGNFNCSFLNIQKWDDLGDLFYLLLVGTGVGFKCTKQFAANLPKIRTNVTVQHSEYKPVPKNQRLEHTKVTMFDNGYAKIYVGDSKEGWVQSLREFLNLLTSPEFENVHTIKISYNSIRPKGERLITFGGTASGHQPLKEMFEGFDQVLKNQLDPSLKPIEVDEKGYGTVRPIHILDMGNLIGANVVVGGVRRTAEIFLFDADDYESMFAKYGLNGLWGDDAFTRHTDIQERMRKLGIEIPSWFEELSIKHYDVTYSENGEDKKEIFTDVNLAIDFAKEKGIQDYFPFPYNNGRPYHHRRMSNNSIAFTSKPVREFLSFVYTMMKGEGEPGFVNLEEAARRVLKALGDEKPDRKTLEHVMMLIGLNPCVEIILFLYNVCNLTTLNLKAFVEEVNGLFQLNLKDLLEAQRLSARIGLRMTLAKLELPHWDKTQKRDRLLGMSLTGWKDAMAMLGYTFEQEKELMDQLHEVARDEADKYAKELRVSSPLLVTAVKPEGTISQVAGGVSSGLHWSHSPYYIRRIRINSNDPLAQVALKLGWNVNPEVGTEGETFEERMQNARTWVIDFPIESGAKLTKDDISAKEQLDTYFSFQNLYTEHNSSNTITVKPDEWEEVEQTVYDNWDNFVGISYLSHDGGTYQLAPYESITKEQYEELKAKMRPFDVALLHEIEKGETVADLENMDSCEGGVCPIR
jgi:adenosylcobalamin-dependent ribonucleoside-triphosphate reductase